MNLYLFGEHQKNDLPEYKIDKNLRGYFVPLVEQYSNKKLLNVILLYKITPNITTSQINAMKKKDFVKTVAAFFCAPELLRQWLESRSEAFRAATNAAAWYGLAEIEKLSAPKHEIVDDKANHKRQQLGFAIYDNHNYAKNIRLTEEYVHFFEVDRQYKYLYLPNILVPCFRAILPKPPQYFFIAKKKESGQKLKKDELVFDQGNDLLNNIDYVKEIVNQQKLSYSATLQFKVTAIKEFSQLSGIDISVEHKELRKALYTLLICFFGDAVTGAGQLTEKNGLNLLKKQFDKLLSNQLDAYISHALLPHIKSGNFYETFKYKKSKNLNWKGLLTQLLEMETDTDYSFTNIYNAFYMRNFLPNFPYRDCSFRHFTVKLENIKEYENNRYTFENNYRVNETDTDFSIAKRALAVILYLLALCGGGRLRIGKEPKSDDILHLPKKPYLSPFDGIIDFSLTALGRWLIGGGEKPQMDQGAKEKSVVYYHPRKLSITMKGRDGAREIFLRDNSQEIAPGAFQFSHDYLFKKCSSNKELQNLVKKFHQLFAGAPPHWNTFFDRIKKNMNNVLPQAQMRVFVLEPQNHDLIRFVAGDPWFNKNTVKIEGYRIGVNSNLVSAMTSRLAEAGFFCYNE